MIVDTLFLTFFLSLIGLTYTNYTISGFNCKPGKTNSYIISSDIKLHFFFLEPASYLRAMEDAGAIDPKQCYLVDDSAQNIDAAQV
jgi:pyrimidine and pyridine-specific 5'-nucleotidase